MSYPFHAEISRAYDIPLILELGNESSCIKERELS